MGGIQSISPRRGAARRRSAHLRSAELRVPQLRRSKLQRQLSRGDGIKSAFAMDPKNRAIWVCWGSLEGEAPRFFLNLPYTNVNVAIAITDSPSH